VARRTQQSHSTDRESSANESSLAISNWQLFDLTDCKEILEGVAFQSTMGLIIVANVLRSETFRFCPSGGELVCPCLGGGRRRRRKPVLARRFAD
jgi:hypothetical protein